MLQNTTAIVLNAFPYQESSLITKLYTRSFGLQACIVKGVRRKNKSFASSLFQPLHIIDIEVYNNGRQGLNILKSASLAHNTLHLHNSIVKSTLSLFLSEVITLSINGEEAEENVFGFLLNTIEALNNAWDSTLAAFHLRFMIDFAGILGYRTSFADENIKILSRRERNFLLASLISFYQEHITMGHNIVSHQVLQEILH